MQHYFVVMWNRDGLQYVADQTRLEGNRIWDRIRGSESEWLPNINNLRLVAQSRRELHYEIWQFLADEGITEEHISEMFASNPQASADTIRGLGQCVYSDRITTPAQIT